MWKKRELIRNITQIRQEKTLWLLPNVYKLKSATHQKTPTQNMKGRKDNPKDRKRQGQHKRPNTNMDRH